MGVYHAVDKCVCTGLAHRLCYICELDFPRTKIMTYVRKTKRGIFRLGIFMLGAMLFVVFSILKLFGVIDKDTSPVKKARADVPYATPYDPYATPYDPSPPPPPAPAGK